MNLVPKETARAFALKNLDFLIVTAKNFQVRYPAFVSSSDKLSGIKATLGSGDLGPLQMEEIPKFGLIFTDKLFNEKHFVGKNFSDKLTQLHVLLQRLIEISPEEIVNVLIASVDRKESPPEQNRNQFIIDQAEKFISLTKDANETSELILNAVIEKHKKEHRIDVLTIASILLLLVGHRQSNVYYTTESLKKVQKTMYCRYYMLEFGS